MPRPVAFSTKLVGPVGSAMPQSFKPIDPGLTGDCHHAPYSASSVERDCHLLLSSCVTFVKLGHPLIGGARLHPIGGDVGT